MKRYKYLFAVAAMFGIMVASCDKNEMSENQPPMQKAPAVDFDRQPYTYLQNKYIDQLLDYEFKKQGKSYDSEKYSYDEKRKMVDILDLEKEKYEYEETKDDILFYTNLEKDLMSEINSHHYVKKFVERFAFKEFYDEDDMIINMGLGDTDDISKYQILLCYEVGFDVYEKCLEREILTGDEEWDLSLPTELRMGKEEPNNSPPIQKAVHYKLPLKWGKTIEYMFYNATSSTKTGTISAMAEWRAATNNKITFSEITKNVTWNKFLWCNGFKYFIKIYNSSGNFSGKSSLGRVPFAFIKFDPNITTTYVRTFRHELGHNLSLYHEHQRPDRDNSVKYYSNNVESGQGSQFSKMTAGSYNYYGTAFDFSSIMLYDSYAYSKNGQPTLTKTNGTTIWTAPQTISANDKYVISQMYN